MLHCPFCHQDAEGLTLYSLAGVFRLMVCAVCYRLLVAKEHQPHSQPMQRLRRLVGLNGREVVTDEGVTGSDMALGDRPLLVAQEPARHEAVSVAEPVGGFVTRTTSPKRRHVR